MKVRIYKGSNNKGMFKSSLPKAEVGTAVDMENDIDQKLMDGYDPEVIIMEMIDTYGKSRAEVKDLVYNKFFNNDFSDEDEEEEVTAPYDNSTDNEVIEDINAIEEEPNNAEQYGYFTSSGQGRDLVNEDADEEEDDEYTARYGGQYADGGQFAPGSIIPQPKKPYYIGMDGEPYDNTYRQGGLTKGQYVKQRIKELRKAAQGDEVKNNETNISPRGTIDNPSGFTSPEKNIASIIKQTGNEAKLKETAENEYQQYQESTMGDNFNGKFLFGGRNRKIKRANKALFGTPIAIPGVDVSYEFGPLGGLRKATADWDLDAIGGLAKFLPGMAGMMPGMGGNYKAVSYPAQVRKKTVSTINNAALDDVAKQNPNSTAAQNNRSDKKNEISCPPGSVYDPSLGHCVDQEGNMVRSIVDLPDPEELLGNPFENPNTRMLNGKKTMKATGPSSSVSSTAASQSTQAPAAGGAPLQSQQYNIPGFIDRSQDWAGNFAKAEEMYKQRSNTTDTYQQMGEDPSQYGYMIDPTTGEVVKNPKGTDVDQRGLVWSGKYDDENSNYIDESLVWSNPANQEEYQKDPAKYGYNQSYIVTNPDGTQSSMQGNTYYDNTSRVGSEFSNWYNQNQKNVNNHQKAYNQEISYIVNMPKDIRAKNYKELNKTYGADILDAKGNLINGYEDRTPENTPITDYDFVQKAFGGSINNLQPDEYGNLQKFVYGGDEYAYGGDVLPQAYDGFAGNFQKQMLATKNRINQMGSKNPADYNPFKGNAFGKATTGVQPSGTVGNRFQPTGEPNPVASTTQNQQGAGAPKQTTTTTTGQPQMDANTMAQFQKYMQMMQGQQGNPFMGNAFGNQQFWTGRPQRLGFGLTRDFNYGNSFSPVNWQVPEGTKGIKQTAYKDRGKWYNPFDTKRITEWRIDNGEEASDDLINKQGSGKNIKTGTTNKSSTGDQSAKDKLIASGWDPSELTTQKEIDEATAHDELINSGAKMNYGEPPTSMKTLSTAPVMPDQLESGAPGRMQPLPASEVSPQGEQSTELQMPENQGETELQNNPFQGNAFEGNQFGTAAGVTPSENMRFTQGPNNFSPSAESTNPFTGNAFGTSSTGVTGNANMSRPAAPSPTYPQPGVENPMADPKFVPTPQDYNPGSNPASIRTTSSQQGDSGYMGENDPLGEMPMAYGGYMAQGGYVPEYMAYGGYMPYAKSGITVENPEFSDPNLIGRTVENSAYTFNPGQFATDMVAGAKFASNVGNAWNQAKQSDLMAQRNRSSDAAKANTGQPGFGSAEVTGTDSESGQMGSKGHYDQYGVNVGSIGFNGNNVITKKGGSINSQYSKGKVYSLTIEQIKAIEAAGGKVEYIK